MYDKAPGIDHIILAVANLEQAAADYALLLGSSPSWRGSHPTLGTRNVLFRLHNTYLELLSADQPGPGSEMVTAHLEARGEGLLGIVFGVDDIAAYRERLQQRGLTTDAPIQGSGTDEISAQQRQWQSLFWPLEASRGLLTFAIEHQGPADSLPLKLSGAGHEITAVDHIVVNTSDGDAAAAFYGETLGIRLALRQDVPQWGGDMLFFRTSHMSIEVIASPDNDPEQDSLWGIAFKTDDIDATHQRLLEAGVTVSEVRVGRKPNTRVCTVKSHHCGIPTLLVELTQ